MHRFQGSFVLTAARGQLVLLQGIWFIQIAEILYKGAAFTCCSLLAFTRALKFLK